MQEKEYRGGLTIGLGLEILRSVCSEFRTFIFVPFSAFAGAQLEEQKYANCR
jgi:hypothetical protein